MCRFVGITDRDSYAYFIMKHVQQFLWHQRKFLGIVSNAINTLFTKVFQLLIQEEKLDSDLHCQLHKSYVCFGSIFKSQRFPNEIISIVFHVDYRIRNMYVAGLKMYVYNYNLCSWSNLRYLFFKTTPLK